MPGNGHYYSDDRAECPDKVRYVGLEKFPKKILVYVSKAVFRPTKSLAIKSTIYINEFLEPVLLLFINRHHSDGKYIFWPDLASARCSKETQAWLSGKVIYVPKHLNPPKVPQARPIENFWGCLAQKVYEGSMGGQNRTGVEATHFYQA